MSSNTGPVPGDVFDVKNLDLQAEFNVVRPFTYSHFDSVANYTHYNQPLAHPLGANFRESVGIVRYQPSPRWSGQLKVIWWKQGLDSANSNLGSNIFKLNTTRSHGDYGYDMLGGVSSQGLNTSGLVSFEWKENLFLDGSLMYRHFTKEGFSTENTLMFTLGVRVNMFRREYDY